MRNLVPSDLCDGRNAESLALCRPPRDQRSVERVLPSPDCHAHDALHVHYKTGGTRHLYQGRFKSFPIQTDGHVLTVMRYVERNPVRADFVELAEDWQWSSAYARFRRADERRWLAIPADPRLPRNWRSWVNKVETEAELDSLRRSVKRGLPFGDANCTRSRAVRLGLEITTRPRGRPINSRSLKGSDDWLRKNGTVKRRPAACRSCLPGRTSRLVATEVARGLPKSAGVG